MLGCPNCGKETLRLDLHTTRPTAHHIDVDVWMECTSCGQGWSITGRAVAAYVNPTPTRFIDHAEPLATPA